MAWTVAFALLGALLFSMLVAPVVSSVLFSKGVREWRNPVMEFLKTRYRGAVRWAIEHRFVTVGGAVFGLVVTIYLMLGGVIGSEFLPHLDEGALWVRGTLAPSTGPSEGTRLANQARVVLCSFPEAIQCTSQVGRPDDGTDTTGFFNTDYFVELQVDRVQAARHQINVADVQDAVQTAVGGTSFTQVLQGEQRYDLVMRYLPQYRDTKEAIENIRLLSPSGERVSLAQLCKIDERDGGAEIYREGNQRYVAIKYTVRGRDLGGALS